jgi:hypothetical protein
MTEAEWLTSTDPLPMLRFLRDRVSDRKLRLYFCGGCRAIWDALVLKPSREAVETAERYADGVASIEDLRRANYWAEPECLLDLPDSGWPAARLAEYTTSDLLLRVDPDSDHPTGFSRWCLGQFENMRRVSWPGKWLIHDLFGNPFRPVAVAPSWLTPTVVSLAAGIYQVRAFDRLPILADALQDSGCENDDVLTHCRGPGPYVRGCWVVDLVLGKE